MRVSTLWIAPWLALAACGGASPARPPPAPAPGAAPSSDGSAAPATGGDDAPGAPLSDAECDQLADHLVELGLADRRAKQGATAAKDQYTAEDAEAAKRELRQSLRPACPAVPRRDFSCAMTAATSAELAACEK